MEACGLPSEPHEQFATACCDTGWAHSEQSVLPQFYHEVLIEKRRKVLDEIKLALQTCKPFPIGMEAF